MNVPLKMITNFPLKSFYIPGGVRSFQFIPAYQVITYPEIKSGQISQPLEFLTGKVWLNGYSTAGQLIFTEESESTVNGPTFNQEITGFYPGDKLPVLDLMNEMHRHPFMVKVTDASGQTRLVGSPGNPLEFTAKYSSGLERADAKGYQFKFAVTTSESAPAYNP